MVVAALPLSAQTPGDRVAEIHNIQFHSSFWMNLHHTLYGAAWAKRPEAGTLRALAGALPAPLTAALTADQQKAWDEAVAYYDKELASRDLLFNQQMYATKQALAAGDVTDDRIPAAHRAILEKVAPVYRRHFWPAHDKVNRAWIDATATALKTIGAEVVKEHERLYGLPWFSSPVRVDVVWVGNRQGAYTTVDPAHAVISSGDPQHKEWVSVEIVFHELSHQLVLPLQRELNAALGDLAKTHGVLWHPIQFHLTGSAVQRVLRARGVTYTPYLYSTGLFDRAWSRYKPVVADYWVPFVAGEIDRAEAIRRTVSSLRSRARKP